tara:strand:+ start:1652 stop:2617 length:966 start_codon:yes stop_codon:yes gene_type:complete
MRYKLKNYTNITENLVFISGVTRSGKSILCPIVSSFKNTENFTLNSIAEISTAMLSSNLISNDVAVYLIKSSYNEIFYNLSIGRNLNSKKFDYSSVTKHHLIKEYKNRISKNEKKINFKKILKKNLFPTMFHDLSYGLGILLKIFPKSKILNIDRHPVDLLTSWKKKGYGKKYYYNNRNLILTFNSNGRLFPYYVKKNFKNYLNFKNDEERIINSFWEIQKVQKKNLRTMKQKDKKRYFSITFDDLTLNTNNCLNLLCKFLNKKKTKNTKSELKKQNCPRKIDLTKRRLKYVKILKKLSKKNKEKFIYLVADYESKLLYKF